MSMRKFIRECIEKKEEIRITCEHIKSATLEDVFALIHIHESRRHYSIPYMNINAHYNGDYFQIIYDDINEEIITVLSLFSQHRVYDYIKLNDKKFKYSDKEGFIKAALDAGVINNPSTRILMSNLRIIYNDTQPSEDFFKSYIGVINTKSARTAI
jgi:hypothetical protein